MILCKSMVVLSAVVEYLQIQIRLGCIYVFVGRAECRSARAKSLAKKCQVFELQVWRLWIIDKEIFSTRTAPHSFSLAKQYLHSLRFMRGVRSLALGRAFYTSTSAGLEFRKQ